MITVTMFALAATLWCGGAYEPARGSNFAPCDDFQRPGQRVESPDGGGSTADAPSATSEAGAAASTGTCR